MLLLNAMSNVPMLMSMEWTVSSIGVAMLLPDMRHICFKYCTLTLMLVIIWLLQIIVSLVISPHPIIIATVLNLCVSSFMKLTQCTISCVLQPKYCLQLQAIQKIIMNGKRQNNHIASESVDTRNKPTASAKASNDSHEGSKCLTPESIEICVQCCIFLNWFWYYAGKMVCCVMICS